MSDERPPPDSEGPRRRRPPPVINLEATEVPAAAAASDPVPEAPASAAESSPKPDEVVIPPPMTPQEAAVAQALAEPPPSAEPPPPAEPPPQGPPPPNSLPWTAWLPKGLPGLPKDLPWMQAGAGAAGGLLLVLLLWLFGAFSGGNRDPSAELNSRLTAIEAQLKELAARPVPLAADARATADLATRLGKLESAQASPRGTAGADPAVLGRLNAAEGALKSLTDNVAAASRRVDGADAALRNMQTEIRASAGSDRASRLAVAAGALRNAVERGDPFTAELDIVKPLSPDAALIAVLEPFAAAGVPSTTALAQELAAVIRPMQRAAGGTQREGNFLDRLQANAEKLVRVRPVEEARGDDRAAILSRVEQRAAQGNIPGAMSELMRLPPAVRAPAQAWIAKADARARALDASRKLAVDAVAALKASP